MNQKLSDWASIAEIIGAAAIVVSLIFVGLEIRESGRQTQLNTQAVQGTALQQHFEQHTSLLMTMISNPHVMTSMANGEAGLDSLTDQERGLFLSYSASNLRNHFVAHELIESGLISRDQGHTFEASLRRFFRRSRGMRELWMLRRDEYPESFQAKIDAMVREAEVSQPGEFE